MKQEQELANSLQPALRELERAYVALAEHTGTQDVLLRVPPVITIQTRGRRRLLLGWCTPKSWTLRGADSPLSEIVIAAESLDRPPTEVLETLWHEAVHQANAQRGIVDCNKAQYHNRHFRTRAEEFGLLVSQTERHGYAETALGPGLLALAEELKPDPATFALARRALVPAEKAPTKMKKWTCFCGVNVRAAVELDVTCNVCGKEFEREDKEAEA